MDRAIREALAFLDQNDRLSGIDVFRYKGDPGFIIAIRFWFGSELLTFLADPDEDRVTPAFGAVPIEEEGQWVDVSMQPGWSQCIGKLITWIWAMTAQTDYTNAIRIEFENLGTDQSQIVEFVVIGSAFRFYEVREF